MNNEKFAECYEFEQVLPNTKPELVGHILVCKSDVMLVEEWNPSFCTIIMRDGSEKLIAGSYLVASHIFASDCDKTLVSDPPPIDRAPNTIDFVGDAA